ncbi:MAG: dihydrolipoamide dehydrogenase [Alphaproteobacteria bacterium CG_4_9_14_3_um_filter_47_13]|nr:MAG: dihydrolipoamide dehydrogenase [Alphaproteobacteria bacterium CG_4_9_14_3_um_filter_47_13]
MKEIRGDVCIIGAGSGGLSVAAGTAQLGLKTILIERDAMGGDCLNTGCVPSKALLAAAKRAYIHRKNDIKGIAPHEPDIDFAAVKDHVFDAINTIAPNDSQERFEKLGVTVIRETARFTAPDTVQAGEHLIKARYIIIATGSRASVPPVPGLDKNKILTNDTIFFLREKPEHLLIIGGGPIGIEMAQAHRRLGCRTSVFEKGGILPRDDQSNVDILRQSLKKEGIALYENIQIREVKHTISGLSMIVEKEGNTVEVTGSHLLVAAGREPDLESLDLEKAGIIFDKKGITVDARLRTNRKKIYAIGDVSGAPQFTHVAGYHAGIIIRNLCFKIPAKTDYSALPWVTYTDPELAQVGLTEEAARKKHGNTIRVATWPFNENDRAITEHFTKGQIRIITDKKGKILGVSIVGSQAGELIGLWALALSSGLKISAVTNMIAPYPTLGEISKRATGAWYTPSLFSNKTRRIVSLLQKLPF